MPRSPWVAGRPPSGAHGRPRNAPASWSRRRTRMRSAAWSSRRSPCECAKPWREADADVCEAIDFCEYYAREAVRLGRSALAHVRRARTTRYFYEPARRGRRHRPVELPAGDPLPA